MSTHLIIKKKKERIELNKYAGKWVAFLKEKVVAYNISLKELTKELDKKNLREKASVFLVPKKDEGPYVLNVL